IGKDEGLGQLFGRLHGVLAYTLLVILAMHIAGALKHRLIDRDMTLQRMTFNHRGMVFPALLILIAGSVFAVCGVLAAKGLLQERGGQEEALSESRVTAAQGEGEGAVKEAASDAPAARRPDTSKLGADEWAIVQSSSTLSFRTTMYGTPFTGVFSHFDGDIRFNPADLDMARADIVIALTDVKTGDADRDSSITGPEWFDTERAAAARFETLQFDHLGGDEYLAIGNLTLRGVTMPVKLPFTLVIDGDTARMTAHTTLNRLDFGMGGKGWDDAATVGHDVDVLIDLTAIR
ncbi:MAG: YceI family protein, partial [Micavibrio sp.]